jgi:hypothetical protein
VAAANTALFDAVGAINSRILSNKAAATQKNSSKEFSPLPFTRVATSISSLQTNPQLQQDLNILNNIVSEGFNPTQKQYIKYSPSAAAAMGFTGTSIPLFGKSKNKATQNLFNPEKTEPHSQLSTEQQKELNSLYIKYNVTNTQELKQKLDLQANKFETINTPTIKYSEAALTDLKQHL